MSDLITADLVLLDENLGDTRFDVIAKLAEAVVKAGRATDFEQRRGRRGQPRRA